MTSIPSFRADLAYVSANEITGVMIAQGLFLVGRDHEVMNSTCHVASRTTFVCFSGREGNSVDDASTITTSACPVILFWPNYQSGQPDAYLVLL